MSDENTKQTDQGGDTQAQATPQAAPEQPAPMPAVEPVFPENSLLTESGQRMLRSVDTKSNDDKGE